MAEKRTHRDPVTGRYDFDGDLDRLCRCGHSLGVHASGGYYCGIDARASGQPEAIGCKCERFRPSGKRRDRSAAIDVSGDKT